MAYSSKWTESILKKKKKEELTDYESNYVKKVLSGEFKSPLTTSEVAFRDEEDDDIAPVKKRTWFNSGALKDGYDFGDITKTILGTAGDIGTNLIKGSAQAGEGLSKLVVGGVAEVSDWVGQDEYADKLRNRLAGKDEEFNERQDKFFVSSNLNKVSDAIDPYSVTGEKTDDLTSSVGTMLAAASAPIPWWVTMGGSSAGHELENAYKSGATSGEAWGSALISGASEVLFEKLSGGISFGGRTLDEGAKRLLSNAITNKTASTLTRFGLDMAGEGFEEVLTEVTSNIGRKLTYEDEKTLQETLFSEEALDNYLEAFIGGAVMGGGFNTIKLNNSLKTGRDYDTGLTQNEQRVVDKEVQNRIAEEEANGKKLTNKQKVQIEERVKEDLQRGNISTDLIESELGGEEYKQYKSILDKQAELDKINKTKKSEIETLGDEDTLRARKKALEEELSGVDINTLKSNLDSSMANKITSDDFLKASYQERSKKGVKFNADLTKYDSKQQKIVQKAIDSGILNDTNKTHDFIDMVAKISADKGIDFDFANNQKLKDSGFAIEGKTVNGFVNQNGITLNMDSNKALNKVVGHEITHILEGTELYTELQNAIMEYDITKKEYGTRYNELKKLYKGVKDADIKKELTADLVGDYLFTDTNFVNNLSTQKPNLFQKIYNEIKYLYKMATAGSKEARQLEKVKKTFEEAYRNSKANVTNDTQYSVSDKQKPSYMWHGTTKENLDSIKNNGFREDRRGYFATNHEVVRSNYGEDVIMLEQNDFNLKDITNEVMDFGMPTDAMRNQAKEEGYDGVKYQTSKNNEDVEVFNIKKLNEVFDKTELENFELSQALGYNLTPEEQQRYNKLKNKNTQYSLSEATDNQGRTLTKEQQEYFKDSKVRDENGNLEIVYHGSDFAGFTEFGPKNNEGNYKYGEDTITFFTNSKEIANSYTKSSEQVDTIKLNSIEDAQNWLENIGFDESVEIQIENGLYTIEDVDNEETISTYKTENDLLRNFKRDIQNNLGDPNAGGIYEGYANITNPYVVDAKNQDWNFLEEYQDQNIIDAINTITPKQRKEITDLINKRPIDIAMQSVWDIVGNDIYNKLGRTHLVELAMDDFSDFRINDIATKFKDTNEIVQEVLESNKNGETNYDGVVFKNIRDVGQYGVDSSTSQQRQTVYVTFNSNQFKAADNTNPTSDADIRYSLGNQDIAPSRNDIYGSDIKLQVEEAIAPLKEEIAKLQESLQPTTQQVETNLPTEADSNTENTEYAALTEADLPMVEQQNEQNFRNIDESNIPIEAEENTPVEEDEVTTTRSLADVRDFDEIGSRKIKAYQYENPEVKPYFQEMATYMLGDLENSVKGERNFNDQLYYDTAGEEGFYGTTRETTSDIAELLDSKYNYSYKDIRKGLEAIIEDHGAENIAVAKRIELALDKRLREGYTDVSGYEIPANQDYIKLLQEKEISDYYSNIPIDESLISAENTAELQRTAENIAPVRRNIDWDSVEDTSQGNQIAFNEEGKTVEIISELEKKQQREYKKLGTKEDYISNKAFELYNEVKGLKKGVKASYELGRVLDVGFANINQLTEGMSETQAKEYKNKIWRDITTALLNVKAKPSNTVNKNSTIEAVIRQNLNREYDSKKNDIANMKEEDLVTKTKKELRKELLIDENDFFINALDNAKNRSMALMNNTDTIRNTELVFGRENAKIINEKIFQKEIDNEADSIAWQNQERQEIKDLGIKARSKESAAVQKYGEKQYVNELDEVIPYGDKELASEFPDVATQDKIKNAAKIIRNKYDNYIDRANEVLTRLGFDPIPKRNDYMRHFQELNDVFSRYGIPFNAQNMSEHVLPTDINGLTENWSPQKNYFANTQARKGIKTTYDAITGVDGYIGGIANLIYHTEDIQRGRAFEELIRETYGEDKGFENLENLPEELQKARIEKIQDNHLSNYAAWVHEWTNNVAGKKSKIDRSVEAMFGRKAFSFLDNSNKQVGANMVGLNFSSSLTNLIAPVKAAAKTKKLAVLKGTADTIKNIFIKDDFMSKNKFLTARMGTDMISKNAWQKMQDAGYVFMKGMDWYASNQIVRSKYYELRAKGMSEQQAHAEAGQFAARIMSDRTKGAAPQIYNSKMLGLITKFQQEVNNDLYSMFYDTYHESKENAKGNALKTAAGMTFTLGQLFAFTHLFSKTFEAIAGYTPTLDVIGILATAFGVGDDEEEEKPFSERLKNAADKLVDGLPYVNILTGGGRIPVASGIPNLVGVATGGKDEYGNELTLEDEMKKLLFLIPPTGGNQVKKTYQGLSMFDEDLPVKGSYTDSGNLRYPVEDTPLNRVQAGLFGQYANKNAGDYFDNKRQPLKEKQIQEYKDLDIPIADYWKYREGLKEQDTIQEKFDYINGLDVSDEQKNIMINNAISRKEQIDMSGYDNFNSYDEFDYATKNPDKYGVISQIDTYDNYIIYKDDIASIKDQFSNENGYSTAERKRAVQEYINSLNLDIPQKIMLEKMAGGYSIKSHEDYMYSYINSLNMSAEEKQKLHNQLFN